MTEGFIYVLNGALEVKNGTVASSIYVYPLDSANSGMSSKLTVAADATVESNYAVLLYNLSSNGMGYDGQIDINGTLKGNLWVMGNFKQGNSVINVRGTVNACDHSDVGIALQGYATLNVLNGASVTSNSTGIEARAGVLNVYEGATIIGNGRPSNITPNGNGTTSGAAGIAVSTYNLSDLTVNIYGGNISGYSPLLLANSTGTTYGLTLNIQGGTFTVKDTEAEDNADAVAMSSVYPENRAAKFITGGTFNTQPKASYVADGYTTIPSDASGNYKTDGTYWTVVPTYTVTWVIEGRENATTKVGKGMTPVYTGIPTRDAVDGTTYTFTGWALDKNTSYAKGTALPAVTGDVTYTAKFAEVKPTGTGNATVTTDTFVETKAETIGDEVVENVKVETTVTTETTTVTEGETTTVTDNQTTVAEKSVPATITVTDENGESVEQAVTAQVVIEVKKTTTQTVGENAPVVTPIATATVTVKAETDNTIGVTNTIDLGKIELNDVPVVKSAIDAAKAATTDTTVAITVKLDATTNAAKTTEGVAAYDVKPVVKVGDGDETPISNDQLSENAAILVRLPVPSDLGLTAGSEIRIRHSSEGYEDQFINTTVLGGEGNLYVEFTVAHFSTFELIPASKVLVSFDSNGGSSVASQAVTSGATATQPTTPTRSGYTFNGWTLNGSAYDFASAVTSDITLVASWTQNSSRSSSRSSRSSSSSTTAPQTTTIVDETTPLSEFPIFYVDVADNSWYHDAIAYVTALELMNGVGDNHFAPDDNTTRGMVAVVMMRLASGEAVDLSSFFDVADSAYYAEAAAWAVENGVFKGYDDGSFRGEINITREQFAAVLYRYALAKGYDVSAKADLGAYDDGALVGGYASDAMAWAIANGIIKGVGNNRLDPLGNATRAQLATMLMRFDELTKDVV